MSKSISWDLKVQVSDGPVISDTRMLSVDAFDMIEVVIPGGDSTTPGEATVEVQPGDSGQVKFLLVRSEKYGAELTYSVMGGASNVALDKPQLFAGEGALGLLGAAPKTLEFRNELGSSEDASISILVGREAIAGP
jgi:hypothetical protein